MNSNENIPIKEKTKIAAVIPSIFAILGGTCCWAPLVLSALGVSAAGAGSFGGFSSALKGLAHFTNYFIILNILSLAISFYFVFIRPKLKRQKLQKVSLNASRNNQDNLGNEIECECEQPGSKADKSNRIMFFSSLGITIVMFAFLYFLKGHIFMKWPKI
ncbi:MAG: hypothetical protein EVJ46_09210 [Candidatus Acididesulfobacter guangdongensis]|uniref:Mercuric transport protein MerT n=1 Tax=Acididesulfobacter guangdongensis TaxID=2597225 RepID=A0A519BEJ9_ACIG2|nr:MAG: hypothetical protein EVJ46_09210 [Candidatus Acididesulfobacter guangdongensis]